MGQCGYAVTWHTDYCCFVCKASAGQGNHGPRCDKLRILGEGEEKWKLWQEGEEEGEYEMEEGEDEQQE